MRNMFLLPSAKCFLRHLRECVFYTRAGVGYPTGGSIFALNVGFIGNELSSEKIIKFKCYKRCFYLDDFFKKYLANIVVNLLGFMELFNCRLTYCIPTSALNLYKYFK